MASIIRREQFEDAIIHELEDIRERYRRYCDEQGFKPDKMFINLAIFDNQVGVVNGETGDRRIDAWRFDGCAINHFYFDGMEDD